MNKRIQTLMHQLPSQSIALVYSGRLISKTADQFFPFEVNRNYYYLTNIDQPNHVLVLIKGTEEKAFLFVETRTKARELWEGKLPTFEDYHALSSIDLEAIDTIENLTIFLEHQLGVTRDQKYGNIVNMLLDLSLSDRMTSPEVVFFEKYEKLYPELNILPLQFILKSMRTIKDELEVKPLSHAIDITKVALETIMKNMHTFQNERDIEAMFKYEVHKRQGGIAFHTIVASGHHATVLHYEHNDAFLNKSELVLLDLGASYGKYNADISRTYPINGKFTPRQKALYELVLSVNEAIIDWVKPGYSIQDFKQKGKDLLAQGALELGLISKLEDITKYYYHGLGHHLGLDVHDVCDYDRIIEPGMVLTVEPGLYIEEEHIGIRIEDDILITETGCINLSKDIIKSVSDIESFMNK
jgi:Xaa-Pro aminopeptidase